MPPVQVRFRMSQVVGTCGRLRVRAARGDAARVRETRVARSRRRGATRRVLRLGEGRDVEGGVRLRAVVRAACSCEVFVWVFISGMVHCL